MRKYLVGTFISLVILSISYGLYLKPNFQSNDLSFNEIIDYDLSVDLDASLGQFLSNNITAYTNAFENDIVAKIKVQSKEISGNSILATAIVEEVYLGKINSKKIKILEDYYINNLDGEYAVSSPSLYIPMQIDTEYIVNIENAASQNIFLLTTPDFSCYPATGELKPLTINEPAVVLKPEEYKSNIFLTADKNYEFDLEPTLINQYIEARNNSLEKAMNWLNNY